jgi:hypothetical protein
MATGSRHIVRAKDGQLILENILHWNEFKLTQNRNKGRVVSWIV